MRKLFAVVLMLCLGVSCVAIAQTSSPQTSPAPPKSQESAPSPSAAAARPGEVDSIDHIIAAVYEVISGPAGPRDWDHFRSFFYSGARLVPTRRDKGAVTAQVSTPNEFATRAQDFFSKEGFFENSVSNRVEQWEHIAHVWSTYESRHAKGDKPFARGINSFQLFNDGTRWWVLTIYWESEDPTHQIPEKYLK